MLGRYPTFLFPPCTIMYRLSSATPLAASEAQTIPPLRPGQTANRSPGARLMSPTTRPLFLALDSPCPPLPLSFPRPPWPHLGRRVGETEEGRYITCTLLHHYVPRALNCTEGLQ